MSKNPATKTSKRDRPKSGDKLKGKKNQIGTPEKSGTPSQDAAEENQSPSRNIIWNEEIEKLQIKEEDLKNMRETSPLPPMKSPKTARVTVKKMKPASEWDRPKPKIVTVAKPAPPDAPVKQPDYSGFAGPRYNDQGAVIPHSLLGSFDDFRKEAIQRGDLLDIPDRGEDMQPSTPTLKYEKKKRVRKVGAHANECNALHNWQMKMMERKKQQGYISRLLQKNPEDLAMNAADNYRKIQEERYIVDRTIPAYDYGKGYRVGSEFWKQQERFGDDETGIHMTLTQTERGYPPAMEYVGIPKEIRQEKGWNWQPYHNTAVHYPWHKNPYLEERKQELQKAIGDQYPHRPDISGLQVVGISADKDFDVLEVIGTANPQVKERVESNVGFIPEEEMDKFSDVNEQELDPLKETQDESPEQIFGPSINFAGQPARWTGDSSSFNDQIGIEARVTFEAYSGDRVTSYLYIINDGTTAVYYDWKKLPKENPFDLVHAHVHRFYFNNSSGVILPGETMKFPFVFKSPNAGVFNEQWKFETRPALCGGAALIVTLRGIALQEDKFQKEREELERDLQQKQANQVVRQIMYDIISGIKTPDRPSSPVDAYIMDEEIFARNNPKLFFNHEAVQDLKQLYIEIAPEEERDGRIWDLSVEDLKEEILQMDEDDERKETFLHQLNTIVSKMCFAPQKPIKKNLYKVGYELLVEAIDGMVRESTMLRQVMGLPEKDTDDLPEDYKRFLHPKPVIDTHSDGMVSRRGSVFTDMISPVMPAAKTLAPPTMDTPKSESRVSSRKQSSRLSREESDMSDSRSKSKAEKAKAIPEKKAPPPKDAKAPKGKEAAKPDPKGKPQTASKKPAGSRGPSATPGPPSFPHDRERTHTPTSTPASPMPGDGDPVVERKYRQKMLAQAYIIMGDTLDKMGQVFDEISQNEDRPPLAL